MGVGANNIQRQELIKNKINECYMLFGRICRSKEEFRERLNATLTTRELEFIKDIDAEDFLNSQLNYIWRKIKEDKRGSYKNDEQFQNIQKRYDESIAQLIARHQEEIREIQIKLKEENEEKFKKNQEKFQNICNDFQNTIKKMEEESKKEREELKKKQKESENNFNKQIKELTKKYEDEKNEEKKKN